MKSPKRDGKYRRKNGTGDKAIGIFPPKDERSVISALRADAPLAVYYVTFEKREGSIHIRRSLNGETATRSCGYITGRRSFNDAH